MAPSVHFQGPKLNAAELAPPMTESGPVLVQANRIEGLRALNPCWLFPGPTDLRGRLLRSMDPAIRPDLSPSGSETGKPLDDRSW